MRRIDDPPSPTAWTLGGRQVALAVDESVYPVPVVVRAAYKLTDRAYAFVHHLDGELAVVLAPKTDRVSLDELVGALANELVDQRVRMDLSAEFRDVHAAIVAEAFSPLDRKGSP